MNMLQRITTAAALALAVGCGGVEGGEPMPSLDGPVEVATIQQGFTQDGWAVFENPTKRCDAQLIEATTEAFGPYRSVSGGGCSWTIHSACIRGHDHGLAYQHNTGTYLSWSCDAQ